MSIGFCGNAHLVLADDTMLLYTYKAYNLNLPNWKEMQKTEDGEICIDREALVEPIIRQKVKRLPSGKKKLIEKRIRQYCSLYDLLAERKVSIKNTSGAWELDESGVDTVAIHLVGVIIEEYQDTGKIPENPGWYV